MQRVFGARAQAAGARFELRHRLGAGTSGSVHAAWDHEIGGWVALKLLDAATDAEAQGLVGEADALRQLAHPDIVGFVSAGHAGSRAWLAMELARGAELTRYTEPARLLPEPLVVQLGARLAGALAHAHSRGVVHRDLKPANVRVDWASGSLKLLDFGLARRAEAAATRTGLVPGSPAYMAPELMAAAPPSARSDLYALGATLFHLLTGRPPHAAESMGELLERVAHDTAPRLRSLQPQASAPLDALLADLLAREPAARPPDATAVAAALRAVPAPTALLAAGLVSRG
jgi:eukaryotic-like serine/threonine-protein kinase